jgi:hypothetical protein
MKTKLSVIATAAALTACGGGGGDALDGPAMAHHVSNERVDPQAFNVYMKGKPAPVQPAPFIITHGVPVDPVDPSAYTAYIK